MIKTGIYGLRARVLIVPRRAAGLVGLDARGPSACVSGVLGVLFALAQHDLKRLLAYHSVENIGIICHGPRRGPARACSFGTPTLAVLGFAGGAPARAEPRPVQGAAVPGRRLGAARDRHAGHRSPGRPGQAHALDRRRLPRRRGGHLRPAPAQRLRQRAPRFSSGASAPPRRATAALAAAAASLSRPLRSSAGSPRPASRKHSALVPRRAAHTCGRSRREAVPSMTVPVLVLAAACAGVGLLGFVAVALIAPLAGAVARIDAAAAAALQEAAGAGLVKVTYAAGHSRRAGAGPGDSSSRPSVAAGGAQRRNLGLRLYAARTPGCSTPRRRSPSP